MSTLLKDFNFQNGVVTYVDAGFDLARSIQKQEDSLEEDVLQVRYPSQLLLDLGWYGREQLCRLMLIKDFNWEEPVAEWHPVSTEDLREALSEAVKTATQSV